MRTRQTARERADRTLLENSVERVINTTVELLENLAVPKSHPNRERLTELLDVNHQDWQELKPVVCALFNEARSRVWHRARTDLVMLHALKNEAGALLEDSRVTQVTDSQARLLGLLLRQVALDDVEHWNTTREEVEDLLRRLAA